jgi:hypothetical protein
VVFEQGAAEAVPLLVGGDGKESQVVVRLVVRVVVMHGPVGACEPGLESAGDVRESLRVVR